MKTPLKFFLLLVLPLLIPTRATAQISVGLDGLPPQTFDTLPPASQWATRSAPGATADITTPAQMDAAVQTNSAALINGVLTATAGTPPTGMASGIFATAQSNLVTRPNGNGYNVLMATLRNDTGLNLTSITVGYDFQTALPTTEQVPGYSVYFSLTGLPGGWQPVAGLSGTNGPSARTATLPLGSWPSNAPLYLLWADDNGSGTPDTANSLDNFYVASIAAPPLITTQPASQSLQSGGVSFSVASGGTPPLRFQWRKDGADLPGATNQTLALINVQPGDAGNYSVLITNDFGSALSSNAALTVGCFTPPLVTASPVGVTLTAGQSFQLSATATGTLPLAYQWRRNGALLPGATNATFMLSNAQNADSGFYSVAVANCLGVATSSNAAVSIASPPFVLVGLTNHFWKYDQSGTDLGTAWRAPLYDDTAWPSGRGVFAQENLAMLNPLTNTVLSLYAPGGSAQILTYYFRTHFNFTGELAGAQLVVSNYLDDGAVVYLNGAESLRVNMPSDPFNYLSLASAASAEGVFLVSNLPPALLLSGDNVLAVEVHQVSLTSSDIAFGMQLAAVPSAPTPLTFAASPTNTAVVEGFSVTFSGVASGAVVHLQWLKDGVPIPGATASTLSLSNATPGDAGFYTLRASNHFGPVFSTPAFLTVIPDQAAPVLLAADLITPTRLQLTFSEPLLPLTATNKLNYQITNTFGGASVVQGATLTNQTNVLLTVTALADGLNHIATARNIADAGPNQNALPATAAPVARLVTLVAYGATWDYYDPFPIFGDPEPGPGWREPGYDITFWGQGAGVFWYSIDESLPTPAPVGTALGQAPTPTAFFRHQLTQPGFSAGGLRGTLRASVNDAVAIYLNGAEIFRTNLPAGTITPATSAVTSAGNSLVSCTVDIPEWLLRPGESLLAAELHQFAANDAQKIFAAEVTARAESLLTGPLLVLRGPSDATVLEGQPATFRVSSVAASAFQWQLNGADVLGATNSFFTFLASIPFDGAQIRCRARQPGVTNLTAHATLHVLPDITRPVLLGARANADGTITLAFSEALSAATALNLANYAVTNADGPALVVTGAVLTNGTNVILSFATPLGGRYTVLAGGVTDLAQAPNAVLPGSAALVGASVFLSLSNAWKYLLINTNEIVQTNFMRVNYDDSAWAGPSNALFYVEDAALPVIKSTPLSLFDSGGVNRINTFYFRQTFQVPILSTGVIARVRHLVDDGLVLHLNGREIYRHNMPAGTITAATQASAGATEGVIVGPVELAVTNLLGGTNLLAAEVHQNGISSGDVVMGVEFAYDVPGAVLTPPAPPVSPQLALHPSGGTFLLSWTGSGFVLESAPAVSGPWTPLAAFSPVAISPTNAAAFYRLRR